MKIGVICPSEIALRRFMPALKMIAEAEFIGIGVCNVYERFGENQPDKQTINRTLRSEYAKAQTFIDLYGGKIFDGYESIVNSNEIEALYIPLPPALHYQWAKKALLNGKHVLVEKPSTISARDTKELISIAEKKHLALHENYMFKFHNQLKTIDSIIKSGEIGDIRLYRINFGFPMRAINDFRYDRSLGGGALIDAGGYTLKYALHLLGDTASFQYATMNYVDGYEVDIYGSAALVNDKGVTAQIAYGMDNNYKCELEVWGSKGSLITDRVLTAPVDYIPSAIIRKGNVNEQRKLPSDDAFQKSIKHFIKCIDDQDICRKNHYEILRQAEMVDKFREIAEKCHFIYY